jgi:hypothetical protein
MSQQVPATFQVKFKNDVELALQQTRDALVPNTTVQYDASAEKVKVKDIVGSNTGHEAEDRHGDTKYSETPFDGVWLPKSPEFYDSDLIDNDDRLQTSIDLTGATMQTLLATIQRGRTRRVLEGFYGPIISGKTGTVVTPFPGSAEIPATTGGASGAQKMNTAKLRAASKYLLQNYVAPEIPRYMVLTADDNDALLTEVPATSSDFKASFSASIDQYGMIRSMLGWNFIHVELDNPLLVTVPDLATDGSGYRRNPFWAKPGLVTNYWQETRTMLDMLPQKRGSVQAFIGTTLAATRTQPGMSGTVLNLKG